MLKADDPALGEAPQSFRAFYSVANTVEALWMDALVLSWQGYVLNTLVPREVCSDDMRMTVERLGDQVEAQFMRARKQVQESAAFSSLCAGDKKRIESILFSPYLLEA